MQQSHLSLSDSEPSIGASRLNLSNPAPDLPLPSRVEPPTAEYNTIDLLIAQQEATIACMRHLDDRIAELERRTWWSMLVTQIKSWFGR